jgi:hypothetical protein
MVMIPASSGGLQEFSIFPPSLTAVYDVIANRVPVTIEVDTP